MTLAIAPDLPHTRCSHRSQSTEPIDVLLVEENPHDVRLLREAFEAAETDRETRLHAATGGADAMAFLTRSVDSDSDAPPNLGLLDQQLPNGDGFDVLERSNGESRLRRLPVVILTGSDADDDIALLRGPGGRVSD